MTKAAVAFRLLALLPLLDGSLLFAGCGRRGEGPASQANGGGNAFPTAGGGGAAIADALPVKDAAAFRDSLLELARGARMDPESKSAYANVEAIRQSWERAYPGLQFTIFYSQPAKPDTVSAGDAFLISRQSENFDQVLAFAVLDTQGRCAGGAAVIPGRPGEYKVSEEKAPTVFKAIEMPAGKPCSGDTAGENYKP